MDTDFSHLSSGDIPHLYQSFFSYCEQGNLDGIKYIFNHYGLAKYISCESVNSQGYTPLDLAAINNHLNIVQYLLTSPKVLPKPYIHGRDEQLLLMTVTMGHLEIIKYLLTSPEIKDHAYLHARDNLALINACRCKHLDIVQYLLTSPELKEHVDIHAQKDKAFQTVLSNGNTSLIHYLIFDFGIEQTSEIKKMLNIHPEIKQLFEKRKLNEKLNQNLKKAIYTNKKQKI